MIKFYTVKSNVVKREPELPELLLKNVSAVEVEDFSDISEKCFQGRHWMVGSMNKCLM